MPLSEPDEKPCIKPGSANMDAENDDPYENRGAAPKSWLSKAEANICSELGLPLLTNEMMSLSDTETSPYNLFVALCLLNGDLY